MLEQFYKYIVKTLLIGYFKHVANKKGDRYYLILDDNAENGLSSIDLFIKAIMDISEPIEVSGIFPPGQNGVEEGAYETRLIQLTPPLAPIIIGSDKSATEDYLVTMRNNIGEPGCKYENYSSLFILSERPHDGANPLSSICTTCTDLRAPGKPLSVDYVIREIKSREAEALEREHERIYFDKYLTEVAQRVEDGSSSLFDLIPALSALQQKSIASFFNEFGFFYDSLAIDLQNHATDKDMEARASLNFEIYQKISDIFSREDESNKLDLLEQVLDEKTAKKIAEYDNGEWRKIDFREINESIDRKNNTEGLELISVKLKEESPESFLLCRTLGKRWNKKTTTHAIICDRSETGMKHLEATFNKKVLSRYLNDDLELEASGKKVFIDAPTTFTKKHALGKNDNHHDFFVRSIACAADFFKQVKEQFTITSHGEIQIWPDPSQGCVYLGSGAVIEEVLSGQVVEYDDQKTYRIKLDDSAEDDYEFSLSCSFGDDVLNILIKVKVDSEIRIDPVENPERRDRYCKWEDEFIRNRATRLVVEYNELQNEDSICVKNDQIDKDVWAALERIFDFYSNQKAGPSLLKLEDDSRLLFKNYLDAVVQSISEIQDGVPLPPAKYYLTKLGVVEYDQKIYFSSFHPLMVAYWLEYDRERDLTEEQYQASKRLTPFYLLPFIRYNDKVMRPCAAPGLENYKNWQCFDIANSKPQDRALDITTRMVCSKMQEFIKHFSYLFQDKDCPIIISTIGIEDDRNVIKGILQFIKKEYQTGVQKIELHEYIPCMMSETFFEKINRLVSTDLIIEELEALGEKIECKGEYTSQEIIHQLFSRVVLYKHKLEESIGYCHIAFYQMDAGTNFSRYPMSDLRCELAFNGLVSIPSTANKAGRYLSGFGTRDIDPDPGQLYTMARLFNNLYVNEENGGSGAYQKDVCLAKNHAFSKSTLLSSIYEKANWVTFLNPEVDIDFFYKQDLYIVHYVDQYSINAKYDSITVTRQINQYNNLLQRSYNQLELQPEKFDAFKSVMAKYFNCLNGNWLLSIVNKTEAQINEKMSIVAASIVMQRFMQRNEGIIWVPVSLEEILRVTGSVQLPKHYIFTKEDLGASGSMSDDLLMMGLDARNFNQLGMYLYPIEVKLSKNNSFSEKGREQVSHTYQQIKDHLFGEENFTQKIFRTFFASLFLINAEKLNANGLMKQALYDKIDKCRYRLLNLRFSLKEELPVVEMGNAALVSFFSQAAHSLITTAEGDVKVCEIHFSAKECFEVVADPCSPVANFLESDPIDYCVGSGSTAGAVANEEVSGENPGPAHGITQATPSTALAETTSTKVSDPISVPAAENGEAAAEASPRALGMRIVLGTTERNHNEIVFEPNNTRIVSHPNIGIIGTMGTGKTQFARSVITQLALASDDNINGKPVGVLIFDYKGDYKDEKFLQVSRGESYKYNFPFNPLKLIQTPDLAGINLPAVTADRISDSFAKAYGLGLKQQGNIKQVIITTYEDFGITRDPSTWNRTVPTMEAVIEKYFETYDANDKAYVLFDKLRDYTIFASENEQCVSIFEWLDRVRVIDLTLYPDDTKKVIVSLILDLFYAEMRQLGESVQIDGYRQLRAYIMVDEAHQFLKKDFNSLRSIISEGRMFGVGMILSTQNLGDFHSANESYSQYILSWVIHHVNSISKSEIASIFGATDPNAERYMNHINNARVFESVCKIGNTVNAMRDLPFFELVSRFQHAAE